jgi:plasmid maintenance system antidote protein VapI
MRVLLEEIGWGSNELARRLGINQRSVRDMLTGRRPVPDNLSGWLEQIAAAIRAVPALPDGWRSGR